MNRFSSDFGLVLEGLGEVWGTILPSKKGPKTPNGSNPRTRAIFKGFGKGLGRVLEGLGDDFRRVLAGSGSLLERFM